MIERPPARLSPSQMVSPNGSARASLRLAQSWLERDRRIALEALNAIFRSGTPPDPQPEGRLAGELIAIDLFPGLDQPARWLLSRYQPWKGKVFDPPRQKGENIFSPRLERFGRLFWPFYREYTLDRSGELHAFPFRTYLAPGLCDPDREVLKIDYDLEVNPRLSVRRVLDELVQLEAGTYLGKANLRLWWGSWKTVAYFLLVTRT
jgi:hypothetical protein